MGRGKPGGAMGKSGESRLAGWSGLRGVVDFNKFFYNSIVQVVVVVVVVVVLFVFIVVVLLFPLASFGFLLTLVS